MKVVIGLGIILGLLVVLPAAQYVLAAGDEPGEYLDRRELRSGVYFTD